MKEYLIKKRFDNEEEAENAATEFIDFCKGRAWVLTDVGAELYGFTHRTFLEYFAASQIVRENTDPARLFDYLVERLRNGGWEVVAQLALQVLNKSVEDGADDFLEILLAYTDSNIELPLKEKLLTFATQALTYIVPRPPVLQTMVTQVVECYRKHRQRRSNDAPDFAVPIHLFLGASSENLPLASKYLYDYLARLLQEDPSESSALSIALYTDVFAFGNSVRSAYSTGRNTDFWHSQIKINAPRFNAAIAVQREVNSSVAMYLLEHGQCSADEMIAWHGPAAVFNQTGSELPGQEFSLASRILLSETRVESRKKIAYSGTEMTSLQIEELKEALLNAPMPWFVPQQDVGLFGGLSSYVLEHLNEGRRRMSNSALLLLLAATFDMIGRPQAHDRNFTQAAKTAMHDAGLSAVVRTLKARTALLGGRDPEAEALSAGQEALFEVESKDIDIRGMLLAAGIDERTATLMQAWSTDPKFRIIKYVAYPYEQRRSGHHCLKKKLYARDLTAAALRGAGTPA